ncbi:hypothetical protein [Paracoccus subflavus]|uniref:hypothetical protein n=1 Tax=Paracoccus subflavus TaxID=2528244 RepID=UPI0013EF1EE8
MAPAHAADAIASVKKRAGIAMSAECDIGPEFGVDFLARQGLFDAAAHVTLVGLVHGAVLVLDAHMAGLGSGIGVMGVNLEINKRAKPKQFGIGDRLLGEVAEIGMPTSKAERHAGRGRELRRIGGWTRLLREIVNARRKPFSVTSSARKSGSARRWKRQMWPTQMLQAAQELFITFEA